MSSSCMLDQAVASILRYSIMPGWSWLSQAGGKHAMPVGMLLVPHRTCRAAHKARCAGATFAQYVTQGGSCAQQGRKTGERPGFQAESQRAAARLIALRRELHKASKPAAAPADAQARSELERAAHWHVVVMLPFFAVHAGLVEPSGVPIRRLSPACVHTCMSWAGSAACTRALSAARRMPIAQALHHVH